MGTRQIGNYRIIEYVGGGGFGSVFKAEDINTPGRIVAIKELHKKHTRSASIKQRFFQEAVAMARLDHPNLPRLHTFGEDGGSYYLVMEFVSGAVLGEEIETKGAIAPERAVAILRQILEAVSYAHKNGIIHRDLKPDNIVLIREGDSLRVKVLDFGIAKMIGGENITLTGEGFGTPNYMSPERISGGHDIDQRTDIYSLGIIFFEMLTGRVPFSSSSTDPVLYWSEMRRLHQSEEVPSLAPNGVPPLLEEVVRKAAAKRPEERYATANEMLAALSEGQALAELLVSTAPGSCEVYVDNVLRGTSDEEFGKLNIPGLTPGLHNVRVTKSGYNTYKIDISLEGGQQTELQAPLGARSTVAMVSAEPTTKVADRAHTQEIDEDVMATLVVENLPAGSAVSIGQGLTATADCEGRVTMKLKPGAHEINAVTPSGQTRREMITVTDVDAQGKARIVVPLIREVPSGPITAGLRRKMRIATAAGVLIFIALAGATFAVLHHYSAKPDSLGSTASQNTVYESMAPPTPGPSEQSSLQQGNRNATNRNEGLQIPKEGQKNTPKPDQPPPQTSPPLAPVIVPPTPLPTASPQEDVPGAGQACIIVFVTDINDQPIIDIKVVCGEEGGLRNNPRFGVTNIEGRWHTCGIKSGTRLIIVVLAPGGRPLAKRQVVATEGRNRVNIQIYRGSAIAPIYPRLRPNRPIWRPPARRE